MQFSCLGVSLAVIFLCFCTFLEMGKVADHPSPRKRGKVEALLALRTKSQREIAKTVGGESCPHDKEEA